MPMKGRKFISEFLLPNLHDKKFGSKLKWLNIEEAVFQLKWNHKSASDWEETDAEVFIEWDKMKGHYRPIEKDYYTKSKQRFRAVLYKLIRENLITEVCSREKSTKIYCIGKKENWELENIMSFISSSCSSYSVENPVQSITEDHRYFQSVQGVSGNEDDTLSFYPDQRFSSSSSSKNTHPQKESFSTVVDESLHNYTLPPSDQPELYVNILVAEDCLKNEIPNFKDFTSKFHQNTDENSSTWQTDASYNSTMETCNFGEECSNNASSFLQETDMDRRNGLEEYSNIDFEY